LDVPDVQEFLNRIVSGHPAGAHWTHNASSAGTSYHDGDRYGNEVILCADAPEASIDWRTTLYKNFEHPYEQEVYLTGCVRLISASWGEGKYMALDGVHVLALNDPNQDPVEAVTPRPLSI
jgi:hypothetical protein